jgi:hypothetical protein
MSASSETIWRPDGDPVFEDTRQCRALFELPQGASLRDPCDEKTSRVVGSHPVERCIHPQQLLSAGLPD